MVGGGGGGGGDRRGGGCLEVGGDGQVVRGRGGRPLRWWCEKNPQLGGGAVLGGSGVGSTRI